MPQLKPQEQSALPAGYGSYGLYRLLQRGSTQPGGGDVFSQFDPLASLRMKALSMRGRGGQV